MALTYLSLTNDVITRMNEVVLTSATFTDARGVQVQCQNAVNESIKKDTDLNTSGNSLTSLNYNEYIENGFANQEDEVTQTTLDGSHSSSVTTLTLVSTTGLSATGFVYIGSEQITYTAISGSTLTGCTRGANSTTAATYSSGVAVTQFDNGGVPPDSLSAHGDTTTIPERFAPVIIDGAAAFVYQYRGEMQQYQLNFGRFEQGIKNMQSLLINKYEYVRSTVLITPRGSANFMAGVIS